VNRLSGIFWSLLFLAVPVLGVATFAVAPAFDIWLPKDVSEHGKSIDGLFYFILALTGVVFVGTELAMFWFLWKYDAAKAKGPATYIQGSTRSKLSGRSSRRRHCCFSPSTR
jgi:cytochrome c oxidase subunit 2